MTQFRTFSCPSPLPNFSRSFIGLEVTDADRWRLAISLAACCNVFACTEGGPRHVGNAVSVQLRTGVTKEGHRHQAHRNG